jgi:hypothetical protein
LIKRECDDALSITRVRARREIRRERRRGEEREEERREGRGEERVKCDSTSPLVCD